MKEECTMNSANVLHSAPITLAWFENGTLGELPPLTRLLFFGLRCMADRSGTLEDDPEQIGKAILRYDAPSIAEVEEMLHQLEHSRMISRYEKDGTRLIEVSGLRKRRHKERA
jgi:hypothetical protein